MSFGSRCPPFSAFPRRVMFLAPGLGLLAGGDKPRCYFRSFYVRLRKELKLSTDRSALFAQREPPFDRCVCVNVRAPAAR